MEERIRGVLRGIIGSKSIYRCSRSFDEFDEMISNFLHICKWRHFLGRTDGLCSWKNGQLYVPSLCILVPLPSLSRRQ